MKIIKISTIIKAQCKLVFNFSNLFEFKPGNRWGGSNTNDSSHINNNSSPKKLTKHDSLSNKTEE
jgi:hypothetical protein